MGGATLLPSPRFVVYDAATGDPIAGGFVYTYRPDGTTPATTWQDAGETTPNANPIILDSVGSCVIYGSGEYQLTVTDPLGNAIPGYSGLSYSPAFISPAMVPVVGAETVEQAFSLLAVNGGTIGAAVSILGNVTIADTLTLGSPLSVPSGGSGESSLTANAILIGQGSSPIGFLAAGTAGDVVTSTGTVWHSASLPAITIPQIQSQVFVTSGSWTCPANVTHVRATVVAGGGGGSFASVCCVITNSSGGWGGLAVGEYTVVPGTPYTVTVGAGGTGSSGGTAASGTTTSFASFASATGGVGAVAAANGANGVGTGGTLRNASGATYAGSILNGEHVAGSSGTSPFAWTINAESVAGIGGFGAHGGNSGAVYLEWVG